MQQHCRIALLVFAVSWMAGCVEKSTPAPGRATGTTPVQPLASPAPAAPQVVPQATATSGAATVPPAAPVQPTTPAAPEPTPPAVAAQTSIQLSTGVALPQTGPEGTMMMFSVDYEFTQGTPDSQQGYVWVIERTHGAAARQRVRLATKGTLQTPIQKWRPEDGPFNSHLEDRKGNRVSESIEMK
jgi:hypothetical protein